MVRIYADFNHRDEQYRVVLDTVGSLEDIKTHEDVLAEGVNVLLYMEDEFEVEGTLVFDGVWLAVPDFDTFRYMNAETS
jgi:hypothetical protein